MRFFFLFWMFSAFSIKLAFSAQRDILSFMCGLSASSSLGYELFLLSGLCLVGFFYICLPLFIFFFEHIALNGHHSHTISHTHAHIFADSPWRCNFNTLKSSLNLGVVACWPSFYWQLPQNPNPPFATISTKRSAVTFMFCTCPSKTTAEQKRKRIAGYDDVARVNISCDCCLYCCCCWHRVWNSNWLRHWLCVRCTTWPPVIINVRGSQRPEGQKTQTQKQKNKNLRNARRDMHWHFAAYQSEMGSVYNLPKIIWNVLTTDWELFS